MTRNHRNNRLTAMTARPGKKADDAVGRRDGRPGLRAGPEVT